jgi:hypothetical protein
MALDVVSGAVTAPGTTFTSWTLATGDSLQVRNVPFDSKVLLLQMWALNNVAGRLVVRSPRMHDNVQGIRAFVTVGDPKPLLPWRMRQPLIAQDNLVAQQTGSAVGGEVETGHLLVWYENAPGLSGRFIDEATMAARAVNISEVETVNTPTASGTYSGEVAINSSFDNFKANVDYALLGYLVSAQCGAVTWKGIDTGNLRVGGPGDVAGRQYTSEWFVRLSRRYGMPLIPVFNASNRFAIFQNIVTDDELVAVTTTSIFAELAPAAGGITGTP